ncbi:hypothetical protein ACOMHN_024399 [Nucella lapillus]
MKQQYVLPDPDIRMGDSLLTTYASKAEALADAFAAVSTMEHLPEDVRQHRLQYEACHPTSDPPVDNSSTLNQPITRAELFRALSSIKKVRAAEGADKIPYVVLRELPDSYMELLLTLYQRCWEDGVIPIGWKHAIVTPILKPGKPRGETVKRCGVGGQTVKRCGVGGQTVKRCGVGGQTVKRCGVGGQTVKRCGVEGQTVKRCGVGVRQ